MSTVSSLQAYGARGGQDNEGTDSPLTYGSHVHAKFRLNRGDRLAVVVGQKGENSQQVPNVLCSVCVCVCVCVHV